MATVHEMNHPLIQHKLSLMRDKTTGVKEFREAVSEIAMLMCYEATRDLPLKEITIETPVAEARVKVISGKKIAIVPILRAGLGMVDGMLNMIPAAKVGHIGLYRDPETLQPVEYYCKLPGDIAERDVIVVDPMLATGGSATAAIQFLKNYGVGHIKLMSIIAAPEGIATVAKDHPDVEIFVAAVDEKLNDHGYIVPGLGDAGDRIFGTK
ncbi:MAG: uracil phosphoribosyltransferase [Intestinibacillus sp.]